MTIWDKAQEWEREWHGTCANSINEELKQLVYAKKMGLQFSPNGKTPYSINLNGKSVLDIGGGPYSLLLKCQNFSMATIVDPCVYPDWVYKRYDSLGIESYITTGENFPNEFSLVYDEVWIYNVLQHTINPEKIISNALENANIIRIFEWIETGTNVGHLHNLTEENLNKWLKGNGKTEKLAEQGCFGLSYYGIFKGMYYDSQ